MKKYRPSNATEGEIFMESWCYQCSKDNLPYPGEPFCEILTRTFEFDIDDPEYPEEWQINENGIPVCTVFKKE